jgi:hypothetical protein
MGAQPQQDSDETLWQMLDTRCPWLVHTDEGLLGPWPQRSLREALWQAWTANEDGRNVVSILKISE